MGTSCRIFIVEREDRILRFTSVGFNRLYEDPESLPIPRLASQRLRAAEAIVELKNRRPVRLLRLVYFLLPFDERGILDRADMDRRQLALLEGLFEDCSGEKFASSKVLDKRHRFVVQGGQWSPSPRLEAQLAAAALEKTSCERFSI